MTTGVSLVKAQSGFERLKETILAGVDRIIQRIEKVEERIENNPGLSETTKQSILESLDLVKDGLISYRDEIEEVETLEELRAANQRLIKYLLDNRKVLRENIEKAIIDTANEFLERTEEFIENVQKILKILKTTCPAERKIISETEDQLEQLEVEIGILKEAIQSKDIPTIRKEIKEISKLSREIRDNLEKIKESCFK